MIGRAGSDREEVRVALTVLPSALTATTVVQGESRQRCLPWFSTLKWAFWFSCESESQNETRS
jgi:hypothetical protein